MLLSTKNATYQPTDEKEEAVVEEVDNILIIPEIFILYLV